MSERPKITIKMKMGPEPLRQPPAARPAKQPRVGRRAVAEEGDALAQNETHKPEVAGAE